MDAKKLINAFTELGLKWTQEAEYSNRVYQRFVDGGHSDTNASVAYFRHRADMLETCARQMAELMLSSIVHEYGGEDRGMVGESDSRG